MNALWLEIDGYRLAADRAYQPETHVWVERRAAGSVRIGLDPLGLETMGTLAQLDLAPSGTFIERGEPLGTLEAEKFVGPLTSPLSGTVLAVNDTAVRDPRLVHDDPFATWLLELDPSNYATEASALVTGDGIAAWFTARLAEYRLKGVLAE
jgi:glycine cleavage system H protein